MFYGKYTMRIITQYNIYKYNIKRVNSEGIIQRVSITAQAIPKLITRLVFYFKT